VGRYSHPGLYHEEVAGRHPEPPVCHQ